MKAILAILVAVVSINAGSIGDTLHDVWAVTDSISYAVGNKGLIVGCTDDSNWYRYVSGTTVTLNAVCFADKQNGWVVGDNGTVLHTTDGWNWSAVDIGETQILNDVYVRNDTILILAGEALGSNSGTSGSLWYSYDNGAHWNKNTSLGSFNPCKIKFLTAKIGWILVNSYDDGLAKLLKTTDGGVTWSSILSYDLFDMGETVYSFCFINENVGWVTGRNSTVYKTVDGGNSWTLQTQDNANANRMYDVQFVNSDTGYAVGEGAIRITTNSGSNWSGGYASDLAFYALSNKVLTKVVGSMYVNSTRRDIRIGKLKGNGVVVMNIFAVYDSSTSFTEPTSNISNIVLTSNPNPFNPATCLTFSLPSVNAISLKVYSINGQVVSTLIDNKLMKSGSVIFNATSLASGTYASQLQTSNSGVVVKRIVLEK